MRNKMVTALFASSLLASALLALPARSRALEPVTHWVALGATFSHGPGTSCADPGYRSNNQDALEDALDAVSAGDVIHICAGEYVYTADFVGPGGDLPDNVTIEGAGAGSTILNGDDQYYLLGIVSADGIVVQDLSFDHAEDIYGAGLWISGGQVDVLNCSFSNNEAGYGGALVAYGGTVVIENSTFTENVATDDRNDYGGAAVYNYGGEITIINSRFVRNESAGVGGAINVYDGPVTISGSTFIGNKAEQGPAIFLYGDDSPLTITGSSFIDNVNTVYGDGSAISSERNNSDMTLRRNTFRGNHGAEYGGAVEAWLVTGKLTITNNLFQSNTAGEGGALWIDVNDGVANIRGNTFSRNRASVGGAIAFECEAASSRAISRLLVGQNRFVGNRASGGARSANVFASDYGCPAG